MLTKKEALEKTVYVWRWIAEECEKQKRVIDKEVYFINQGIPFGLDILRGECYICEYAKQHDVNTCLIEKWNLEEDTCYFGCCEYEYGDYCDSFDDDDYKKCAKAANAIADLAEMELKKLENEKIRY